MGARGRAARGLGHGQRRSPGLGGAPARRPRPSRPRRRLPRRAAGERAAVVAGAVTASIVVVDHHARELLLECLAHVDAARAGRGQRADRGPQRLRRRDRRARARAPSRRDRDRGAREHRLRARRGARDRRLDRRVDPAGQQRRQPRPRRPHRPARRRRGRCADRRRRGQVRFSLRPGVVNSAGLVVDRLGVAYERLAGRAHRRRRDRAARRLRRDRVRGALPSGDARRHRRLRRELLRLPARTSTSHGAPARRAGARSTSRARSPTIAARRPPARGRRSNTCSSGATGCGCWPRTRRPPSSCATAGDGALRPRLRRLRRRHRPHPGAAARPGRGTARMAALPRRRGRRPAARRRWRPRRPAGAGRWGSGAGTAAAARRDGGVRASAYSLARESAIHDRRAHRAPASAPEADHRLALPAPADPTGVGLQRGRDGDDPLQPVPRGSRVQRACTTTCPRSGSSTRWSTCAGGCGC